MQRISITFLALAALAGCGSPQPGNGDTAVANQPAPAMTAAPSASGTAASVPQFTPGQWLITAQMLGIEQIGAIPALAAKIAAQQAEIAAGHNVSRTNPTCITPAEGAAGAPQLFMDAASHYERAQITGDAASATLVENPAPPALPSRIDYSGTLSPSAYQFDAVLTISDPAGARITIRTKLSGRRIGDCPQATQ